MPDFRPVLPGQDFSVRADTWNAILSAAQQVAANGGTAGGNVSGGIVGESLVKVINTSGSTIEAYYPVEIIGPLTPPSGTGGDEAEHLNQFVLQVKAVTDNAKCRWVVLRQTLADGAVGYAYDAGIVPCYVSAATTDRRCDVATGTAAATGGISGYPIISIPSGSGARLATVAVMPGLPKLVDQDVVTDTTCDDGLAVTTGTIRVIDEE